MFPIKFVKMKDGFLISSKHTCACVRTHTQAPVKISCSALINYLLHKNGGRTIVQSTEYEDITGPPNPEICNIFFAFIMLTFQCPNSNRTIGEGPDPAKHLHGFENFRSFADFSRNTKAFKIEQLLRPQLDNNSTAGHEKYEHIVWQKLPFPLSTLSFQPAV